MTNRKYFESLRQQLDDQLNQRNSERQTINVNNEVQQAKPMFLISQEEQVENMASADFLNVHQTDSKNELIDNYMVDLNENRHQVQQQLSEFTKYIQADDHVPQDTLVSVAQLQVAQQWPPTPAENNLKETFGNEDLNSREQYINIQNKNVIPPNDDFDKILLREEQMKTQDHNLNEPQLSPDFMRNIDFNATNYSANKKKQVRFTNLYDAQNLKSMKDMRIERQHQFNQILEDKMKPAVVTKNIAAQGSAADNYISPQPNIFATFRDQKSLGQQNKVQYRTENIKLPESIENHQSRNNEFRDAVSTSQKSLKSILKKKSVSAVSQDSSASRSPKRITANSRERVFRQLDDFNRSQELSKIVSPTSNHDSPFGALSPVDQSQELIKPIPEMINHHITSALTSEPNLVLHNSLGQMNFPNLRQKHPTKEMIHSDLPSSLRERISIDDKIVQRNIIHQHSKTAPGINTQNLNQNSQDYVEFQYNIDQEKHIETEDKENISLHNIPTSDNFNEDSAPKLPQSASEKISEPKTSERSSPYFSTPNLKQLFNSLYSFKSMHQARLIVDSMDQLKLHSEKTRRTMLRVQARSNIHRKRLGWKMLVKYIQYKQRKRINQEKSIEQWKKNNQKKMLRTIQVIKKTNKFESKWIKNVRFELYFAGIMQEMIRNLQLNVKLRKIRRNIVTKRCYKFLQILKSMADSTFNKQHQQKLRFQKRQKRQIYNMLKKQIFLQKEKRQNQLKVIKFRQRKLLQYAYKRILNVKIENDLIRNDKILSQAYDENNENEFFQVQIRKENRMFNDKQKFQNAAEQNQYSWSTAVKFQF